MSSLTASWLRPPPLLCLTGDQSYRDVANWILYLVAILSMTYSVVGIATATHLGCIPHLGARDILPAAMLVGLFNTEAYRAMSSRRLIPLLQVRRRHVPKPRVLCCCVAVFVCCAVLCCAVLCCAVVCCAVVCCCVLCCAVRVVLCRVLCCFVAVLCCVVGTRVSEAHV